MAVYKVPQDVEADDKLIGPFSFRQFVYLIIVAIAIAIGYGLSRLFIPLAIIPLPIIVFFGALALPLRKDQPMEIYLAAVVSFFLKPRRRLWQPDGLQTLIEITAPKTVEVQRSKDLSQSEAEQRLSYLADIVDTRGWAVRGVEETPTPTNSMQGDVYFAAQQTEDILDDTSGVAQSFDSMINQADAKRHEQIVQAMHQTPTQAAAVPQAPAATAPDPYAALTPVAAASEPQVTTDQAAHMTFNPYPNEIHQSVVQPLEEQARIAANRPVAPQLVAQPATPSSETTVSPDIINLANNPDLSIETIAHEAKRIQQKEATLPEDEVVVSLR